MSPDSFNSNRTDPTETRKTSAEQKRKCKPAPRAVDIEGEATESFSFHVSAAEAADLQKKVRVDAGSSGTDVGQGRTSHLPPIIHPVSDLSKRAEPTNDAPLIRVARPTLARRKSPSLVASLMLHAILLLPFGFFTQTIPQELNQASLLVSFEPHEEFEQIDLLDEVEVEIPDEIESFDTEFTSDIPAPDIEEFAKLSKESAFTETYDEGTLQAQSLGDLNSLFGNSSDGIADLTENLGGAPAADFFGTKVEGNRVVYVLDNSGGMREGEIETLIVELLRSVESLRPKQYFYVIFYSDALYPLFYPHAPQNFVRATKENKRRLEKWLDSVEFCVGNVVDDALAAATSIRPDVVYLLTDGDLDSTRDQRRIRFLLDSRGRTFPIHTFGLGTGKTGNAALKLKQVAQANGGTFRAVEVEPDARALAKVKARPYHNKSPGKIWGLHVGKRKR